mgnify:CR=1 FL=1
MGVIVKKFGGTSLADIERINRATSYIINSVKKGNDVVVVVSAMGKETNRLLSLDDDLEEFVPVSTHDEKALLTEIATLFDNPPVEAPPLADDIKIMLKAIEFEESRVATIKKWIKEDGMDKQEAKDRFQKEMDALVRDALDLPEETEQEREYRERAVKVAEERAERLAAAEDGSDSEE